MKTILVITNSIDLTCDYLINKYSDKVCFFRFNTDRFFDYNITISPSGALIEYKDKSSSIHTESCDALYYRKISLPDLTDYEEKYRHLMLKEMLSTIDGIAEIAGRIALTRPSILRSADNKIVQLLNAREVGFKLPESLITNSDIAATNFTIKNPSIIKPISVGKIVSNQNIGIIQTNLVDYTREINGLSLAPAYFQSYEKKDYEVRLTIVNEHLFGVRIDSTDKVDWRKENSVLDYFTIKVPQDVEEKCLAIMKKLHINFAAFDFIVREDQYFFLELNVNGQWLWLEKELNLKISESIISTLVGGKYE